MERENITSILLQLARELERISRIRKDTASNILHFPREQSNRVHVRRTVQESLQEMGDAIHTFEGLASGPSIFINGGTHGNEMLGVVVANIMRSQFHRHQSLGPPLLLRGTVHVGLGNPAAVQEDVRTLPGRPDMNRIFLPDVLSGIRDEGSEGLRAKKIAEVVRNSDIVIDLHSTNRPSPAFVCASSSERHREVYKWFPRIATVTDPDRIVSGGGSLDEFADDIGGIGVCYESGQALDFRNVQPIRRAIMQILIERGMVDGCLQEPYSAPEYRVVGSIPYHPHREFIFAQGKSEGFAPVTAGEILGTQGGEPVYSLVNGVVLFPKLPEHQPQAGVVCYLAALTDGKER